MIRRHAWRRLGGVLSLPVVAALGGCLGRADLDDDPWGPLTVPDRALVEVFRLGGEEPAEPEMFTASPRLLVDEAGRLHVLLSRQGRVAVFDEDGGFLQWIGEGRGQGPGEFTSPSRIGLLGDTLWIRNQSPPTLSRFLTDGTLLDTDPVLVATNPDRHPTTQGLSGYLTNGRAWVEPDGPAPPWLERSTEPAALELGTRGINAPRDTVLTWRGNRGRLEGLSFAPLPELPIHAVAPDGSGIALVEWSDEEPERLHLRVLEPTGRERWAEAFTLGARPLSQAERDAMVNEGRERVRELRESLLNQGLSSAGAPQVPTVEDARERIRAPAYVPPVRAVQLGIDGLVWLHLERAGPRERWVAVEPGQGAVFAVDLPEGARLGQGTRDAVWYMETDELGVAYLVKARLSGDAPGDAGPTPGGRP